MAMGLARLASAPFAGSVHGGPFGQIEDPSPSTVPIGA